ncbi:sulfatase [Nocardioides sp. R-C-SC26]|uniref:sulfatase family protein n=1 Tax=Nocardioides sp. R-C-SC26 TaxID=2870414 RepID=UPI001E52AF8E|nr:sulfatase [Nocardioides sp. R-C-SC26]
MGTTTALRRGATRTTALAVAVLGSVLALTSGLVAQVPTDAASPAVAQARQQGPLDDLIDAILGETSPTGGELPHFAPLDRRPNIVLISADDMRADEIAYMPETRKLLGRGGLTFTEALTPHPLCCPARAEILTGQYAQNNGVRTNFPPQGGYRALDTSRSIATWLNDAGYNTAFVGKHLNSVRFRGKPDPGWTLFDPTIHGYNDYIDFEQFNDGKPKRIKNTYYTDYVARASERYVKALSRARAPFFLWVSHFGPHSRRDTDCADGGGCAKSNPVMSKRYLRTVANTPKERARVQRRATELMASPAFNEADISDKPKWLRHEPVSRGYVSGLSRSRIGALWSVDRAVARVISSLRATDELANTYVVFITDNGYLLGEHRHVGKTMPYEEAVRTPMLVRGPGVKPGTSNGKVVTIVDLPATFLDIADTSADMKIDGTSLLGFWRGTSRRDPHRGGVLIQAGPVRGQTGPRGWYYRGIRTDRYTYARYFDGWVELYDRALDPHQISSVARDPRYAAVRAELERRTAALSRCAGPAECNRDFGAVPSPTAGG